MNDSTITRRSFLQASAAAGLALAAGTPALLDQTPRAFADEPVERTAYKTACHGCCDCCPVIVYKEDGVVVKIEGDPDGPLNKGACALSA